MRGTNNSNQGRNRQRGVSLILVAVAMVGLLAVSALAIDLASLYVARNEAQRAADSAALAGAKVFVETGFISGQSSQAADVQGAARTRAINMAAQNKVAGQAVTILNSDVTFNSDFAPSKAIITVLVKRTMPTFFAKAFGVSSNNISAKASAEAFDPLGGKLGSSAQIGVACLKPFFVPNCDLHHSSPSNTSNCRNSGSAKFASFFNSDGSVANAGLCTGAACAVTTPGTPALASGGIIGETLLFDIQSSTPPALKILDLGGGSSKFTANVTTCNTTPFTCASSGLSQLSGTSASQVDSAAETLIHASGDGLNTQDTITVNSSGNPFTIRGGTGNPNPSLRGVSGIATSDSIVTLPVYDNGSTSTIVGFLQVFITQVNKPTSSDVNFTAVIMNAFGCNCGGGSDSYRPDEEGGGGCCGGGGDSHKSGDGVRGDEGGGGGGCITVQGPGGSPFLIRLINPGGGEGGGGDGGQAGQGGS